MQLIQNLKFKAMIMVISIYNVVGSLILKTSISLGLVWSMCGKENKHWITTTNI